MTTTLDSDPRLCELPEDLREWLGERGLVKLALEALQTVALRGRSFTAGSDEGQSPQMLLTLLSYGFSAGFCGSEEIARAAHTDPTVRYICAHNSPGRETIRRFRRAHRQVLEHCLVWILAEAWKLKRTAANPQGIFEVRLTAEVYCSIVTAVRQKLDRAVRLDATTCG